MKVHWLKIGNVDLKLSQDLYVNKLEFLGKGVILLNGYKLIVLE